MGNSVRLIKISRCARLKRTGVPGQVPLQPRLTAAATPQIKPGQQVVVLRQPDGVEIESTSSGVVEDVASADGALVFVAAAAGTDLNRDKLAALVSQRGVQPVRQVSVDSEDYGIPYGVRAVHG